jgi:hypothetical protein
VVQVTLGHPFVFMVVTLGAYFFEFLEGILCCFIPSTLLDATLNVSLIN